MTYILRSAALLSLLLVPLAACGDDDGGSDDGGTTADAAPTADSATTEPDAGTVVDPNCEFLDCDGTTAWTCEEEPFVVDCSAFGATCGDFTNDETGEDFRWCDCGDVEELDGFCLEGQYGIACFEGLGGLSDCGPGWVCAEKPETPFGIGCDCDNAADGLCPAQSCVDDPDCEQA